MKDKNTLRFRLDGSKDFHNGLGYDNFVSMVGDNPTKPKVDKANLARAFGVTRPTIYDWLEDLEAEMQLAGKER